MTHFATGFTRSGSIAAAARELAGAVEATLGPDQIGGGFLFATAASGQAGTDVGEQLAARWPEATLLGSTFEGVLAGGRAWRDEPAIGLMAWTVGPDEPIPVCFAPGELDVEGLAHELLEAADRPRLGADDLLLLFPDSLMSVGLEAQLESLLGALGAPAVAGSAASGLIGGGCRSWSGSERPSSACVGLLVPGPIASNPLGPGVAPRVRCAGATRFASPWLEISACRERWIDGLEGEPPLDWVRRQLGLSGRSPVEPHLDRMLVRIRNAPRGATPPSAELVPREERHGDPADFVERYVVGIDDRRGSISLPGSYERGGHLALALPDPDWARIALRSAIGALAPSPLVMQFACRARDASLHGDPDLEPALVAHGVAGRSTLGTLAPFQLGPDSQGAGRMLVHSTVLAALGNA